MKPGTRWIAIVLLAVGLCGILDATGLVESSQTIGTWWPLAVIGWPLVEMVAVRRVTLGGVICLGIGLTLLADELALADDGLVWSMLAAFIGLALLVEALMKRGEGQKREDTYATPRGGAS